MREPGTLKRRIELSVGRSGIEAWKRAPRADYKKMSRGVLQGKQPEVGNSLLMVTPPGSPLPATHANDLPTKPRHCLTQMHHHTPKAPLTETTSLIYHDPVYHFAAERHHPDGWPSSKVQGVCVCMCVCTHLLALDDSCSLCVLIFLY